MIRSTHTMLRATIVGVLVIVSAIGCASSKKKTTASTTTGSNLSPVDRGRAIYTSTCTRCHSAKTVSNYTLSDWTNVILPDMASRAGLSSSQEQDVLAYVQSVLGNTP